MCGEGRAWWNGEARSIDDETFESWNGGRNRKLVIQWGTLLEMAASGSVNCKAGPCWPFHGIENA